MAQVGSQVPVVTLLPAQPPLDPNAALAAAAAEASADFVESASPSLRPYGRSWAFDFTTGQFIRHGMAPAEARGLESLRLWIQMALLVRRFGTVVFSGDFGLEMYEDVIGRRLTPDLESALAQATREALLVHDRIKRVDGFTFTQDLDEDFVVVGFVVTTDRDESLNVGPVPLLSGGA